MENIDIDIDIDMVVLEISISIRQFCKISISIKYRIDSNLAYRTGLEYTVKKSSTGYDWVISV